MNDVAYLRKRAKRDLRIGLALALLITVFLNVAVLVVPIYDMQLYDRVLQSQNMSTLALLSIACFLGLLLYALLDYLRSLCFMIIGDVIARRLQGIVLEESIRNGAKTDSSGEMMQELNNLRIFLTSGALAVPLDALCACLLLFILFLLHPTYGFLGLFGISTLITLGIIGDSMIRPALLAAQDERMRGNRELTAKLRDPEIINGLGMLSAVGERWAWQQVQTLDMLRSSGNASLIIAGISRMFRLGLQAGVMIVGAILIIGGATTPGSLMGANLLLNKSLSPFDHLISSWRQWALAHAGWQRIHWMLENSHPLPKSFSENTREGLQITNIHVDVGSKKLLDNISFHVPKGSIVCLQGHNGAGKSTLLRLICGLYPEYTGQIAWNGQPITNSKLGYLPQSVSLMDGTIAENISRFEEKNIAKTIEAARWAGVHELIGRMPRGYETEIKDGGNTLSGGMRQRIGLARAVFGNPDLLILDEPDANLDGEGSIALFEALRNAKSHGTIVIVTSHRPAMVEEADYHLILEKGKVLSYASKAQSLNYGENVA